MKRFIDGFETDLPSEQPDIEQGTDRLFMKTPEGSFSAVAVRRGDETLVSFKGRQYVVSKKVARSRVSAAGSGELRAPMPGLIVDVLVTKGDAVHKGQKILVLEAMKTQQPFVAPFDGEVTEIRVEKGAQVVDGAILALISAKS
jgi:biotin carboxyl carrier protein